MMPIQTEPPPGLTPRQLTKWRYNHSPERLEKRRADAQAFRDRHPEKSRAQSLANYYRHKDAYRERQKKWRDENKEHFRALQKNWGAKNKKRIHMCHITRTYGLTAEEYEDLLVKHDYRCAICKSPSKLNVDHDHMTGKVRGLLCRHCNYGLGHFRDKPEILRQAALYLEGEVLC